MKHHSMACPFPEGCSCGASEFNALERERDTLRALLTTTQDQLAARERLGNAREQTMRAALEPLVALADANDALLRAHGCIIPAVHDGDDSSVAMPDLRLTPFLRKRSQPHYLTMRDAVAARKALS